VVEKSCGPKGAGATLAGERKNCPGSAEGRSEIECPPAQWGPMILVLDGSAFLSRWRAKKRRERQAARQKAVGRRAGQSGAARMSRSGDRAAASRPGLPDRRDAVCSKCRVGSHDRDPLGQGLRRK
jgi:hypothetical protein